MEFIESNFIELAVILGLFLIAKFFLAHLIRRIIKLVDDGDDAKKSMAERRAETLGKTLITTGNVVLYSVIFVMLLNIFGVDIRPILVGAGIVGLTVGFGAQSLVKDFVAGLFVLIENQYAIGEKVKIGSAEGTVVKITMRITVLKDDKGDMHYISNGLANNVINYSRK